MKKSESDSPIVEEVREARRAFWAEHDNDIDKVFDAVQKAQEEARSQGVKFADHLKPKLPPDFYERLAELRAERSQNHFAS
jgi:hypothetical protein